MNVNDTFKDFAKKSDAAYPYAILSLGENRYACLAPSDLSRYLKTGSFDEKPLASDDQASSNTPIYTMHDLSTILMKKTGVGESENQAEMKTLMTLSAFNLPTFIALSYLLITGTVDLSDICRIRKTKVRDVRRWVLEKLTSASETKHARNMRYVLQ